MDKRGQVVMFTLMIAIVIIILALAFIPTQKNLVETARNTANLDCGNESISDFDKLGCLAVDLGNSYFIIGLIFLAGAVITARVVIQ